MQFLSFLDKTWNPMMCYVSKGFFGAGIIIAFLSGFYGRGKGTPPPAFLPRRL